MKEREQKLEDWTKAYCERRKWLCLKLELNSQRGWPDRTIIAPRGRVLCLEFKTEDGKASPHQNYWRKKLGNRDIPCEVVRTQEEVLEAFAKHFSGSIF